MLTQGQRYKLLQQFTDADRMMQPKDVLSISDQDLQQGDWVIKSIARDLQAIQQGRAPPHQAPTPQAQPVATPTAPTAPQQAPLSAANLEAHQTAASKQNNRAGPKSGQAPPAPTSGQAPFPLGGPTPHGQPNYANPKKPDFELRFPPNKKPKLNAQGKATAQSPTVSKVPSPDLKRQQQPQMAPENKAPPKPVFKCTDPFCDATDGFLTEAARDAHEQAEHVLPLQDPLKYAEDNISQYLVLNEGDLTSSAPAAPPMVATQSKTGQTPSSFVATPMSRGASMNRSQSRQDSKALAKADTPAKAGEIVAPMAPDVFSNCIDPQSLFAGISGIDGGLAGVFADTTTYRALTPNDTPESSKDSGSSEPNSDITENANIDIDMNWQPLDDSLLMDLGNINMESLDSLGSDADLEASLLTDALNNGPSIDVAWEELNVDYTKPFTFDGSLYSMDTTT